MGPTGLSRPLQIHPTRQCNLSCLHCYSSSSPLEKGHLPLDLLIDAISDAANEGFNYVSISGGEPMLYKPLGNLLDHAHSKKMRTAVTTNGMLLTAQNIEQLCDRVDVLAISIDGVPASHNRMRGSELAFKTMKSRLPLLRAADIPFGFIFTLTQYNLDELDWVLKFAVDQGAKLLQIHPLEEVGNAATRLLGNAPDATESAYAWMLAQQKINGDIKIQIDLVFSETIKKQPESVFAGNASDSESQFSELVAPLVIEADGTVSPIQYDFAHDFTIGNLKDNRLSNLLPEWRRNRMPAFYSLCREVYEEIAQTPEPFFLNWYQLIGARARSVNRITQDCDLRLKQPEVI